MLRKWVYDDANYKRDGGERFYLRRRRENRFSLGASVRRLLLKHF
jgi:hypothetical protein